MQIRQLVVEKAKSAKDASRRLLSLGTDVKNRALLRMADYILEQREAIKEANQRDVEYAKDRGLSRALIDRLTLTDKRIEEMAGALREVASLPDPVGEIIRMWQRPNGMMVGRMRVPIGVIGIIYEARPNVTVEATSLCLKAGNAVLLRGGSEAINSNLAIVQVLRQAASESGVPEDAISFIDVTDRTAIMEMIKLEGFIDLVIPRGGEGLIRTVTENYRVHVLKN